MESTDVKEAQEKFYHSMSCVAVEDVDCCKIKTTDFLSFLLLIQNQNLQIIQNERQHFIFAQLEVILKCGQLQANPQPNIQDIAYTDKTTKPKNTNKSIRPSTGK